MKLIAADITTQERKRVIPTAVPVEPTEENGLAEPCYVICHDLTTFVEGRLDAEPIGQLSPADLWQVEEALQVALGIVEMPPPEGYDPDYA